jgi:dipeptidyl aminopeptidase/acylaminoacyl peptidase
MASRSRSVLAFILPALFGLAAAWPTPARADGKPARAGRFGLEHLGQLVRLSDPQIAPDGRSVVVVASRPNYEHNRHDAELMLVDVASGQKRILTHERTGVSQPRWSPSGDRLAFLAVPAGKAHGPQIHVMPMNGGDARRITDAPAGVQHYAWSPDSKEIAYAAADEPADKAARDKDDDAFEVTDGSFLETHAPTPVHAWLVPAEGGTARRLTSGPWSLHTQPPPGPPASPLSWSPDGKTLLLVRQDRPSSSFTDRTAVQLLDVATGKLTPLTGRKTLESAPTFSPDGARVAYRYWRDGEMFNQSEVWVAPTAGGEGRCLSRPLDRCLYLSAWLPDGKGLLVGGNDGTRTALWLQPLDGTARRLDLGAIHPTWGFHVDAQVGKTGAIAFTGSEPGRPTELYYLASPDAAPRRLTDFHHAVAALDLGKVESIAWPGPDGFRENGVLIYPPGFDAAKKYPLVLLIHGGPMAASTEAFSAWAQLIAAHGYVVFQPNYRGSDNMGAAFQRAVFGDAGDGPGRDVMAGLEAVQRRGFVDAGRLAVTGWSYGGYMTTWLIGHHHVWKTAIAGAAVTDWSDAYNLSDLRVYGHYVVGGSPWTDDHDRAYRAQSPINYARQIKTPTLIVATTGDARVPVTQSHRLYHALRDNGVPVKFIAYPVAGHFPADPVRQKDVMRRWVAWLDEHLR